MIALFVLFPLHCWVQLKGRNQGGCRYRIRDKGVSRRFGDRNRLYKWTDVEGYRFYDHENFAGVRVLELHIKRYKKPRNWYFDPQQVDEREIGRLLSEFGVCPLRV